MVRDFGTFTNWTWERFREIFLVIGSTGVNAPTSKQVAKVALMLEQNPALMDEIETIGKIARRGIDALIAGDYEAVGRTMTENQIMLKSIGVSSPELDVLIKAAAPSKFGSKIDWRWRRWLYDCTHEKPQVDQRCNRTSWRQNADFKIR